MIDRLKNLSCYRLSQGGSQFKDIKNHFEELIKVDRKREKIKIHLLKYTYIYNLENFVFVKCIESDFHSNFMG